ncbi:MAG: tetratricopeptide repeat protein, partial [Aureispira sp.]
MLQKNNIKVDGNGNITIQGIHDSQIQIDTSNAPEILHKLEQLEDSLLKELVQVAEQERAAVGELFMEQLSNFITQKNSIKGNVSDIKGNVSIGDTVIEKQTNIYNAPPNKTPKDLSVRLPKLEEHKIIGRANDLKDLHQRLFNHQHVVVVNGMGGIGKTTLAQVYLTKYYEAYQHILWVSLNPAVKNSSIKADLVNTEGLLKQLNINRTGKKIDELFAETLSALKALPAQPCLLILDNATAALEQYQSYLPSQPHWHLLATSREKIENFDLKELDFLSEAEAIQLFELHYKRQPLDPTFLKALVKDLEYHTLTLEILAKTAHNQRSQPQELLTAIQQDLPTNVTTRHSQQQKIDKLTSYLCSIFEMTGLEEAEKYLLQQLIALPAEWQTFEVLEELLVQEGQSRSQLSSTLSALVNKGWLLENQALDSYKLHKVIIDVVQRTIPPSEVDLAHLIAQLTVKLSIDQTKDNPVDKFVWVPYGKAVLEQLKQADSVEIAELQNNLGIILQDLGDYEGARALLAKGLSSAEANFGELHPTTAVSYSNLGMILQALGEYEGARALLEKAVISNEVNFGEGDSRTAVSYSNLGSVLQALGDYEGARVLLERAVVSNEVNFEEGDSRTAVSYSNLGIVLQALGEYEGARALLAKALASDEANFGKSHPNTAVSYSNLGLILNALGDYE